MTYHFISTDVRRHKERNCFKIIIRPFISQGYNTLEDMRRAAWDYKWRYDMASRVMDNGNEVDMFYINSDNLNDNYINNCIKIEFKPEDKV